MHDTFQELISNIPEDFSRNARIAVMGIGGGGCNAVNNMISGNIHGVDFYVVNTDNQSLATSLCQNKIHIGDTGLGAGSIPENGKRAAEHSIDDVFERVGKVDMLFIAAGMGGGTGTGASPVIAQRAKEMGALTIAVVTKPFLFEGIARMKIADAGIKQLESHLDTLIVVPNQNLFKLANEKTTMREAFLLADQVLHDGVCGITDLMMQNGLVNLDFADVKTIMTDRGRAVMGFGVSTSSQNRGHEAAESAISNHLMDTQGLGGAQGILMNITGGPDLTLFEVESAAKKIHEEEPNAKLIFGACIRDDMEGKVQVTVFGAGMDNQQDYGNNSHISNSFINNSQSGNNVRSSNSIRTSMPSANAQKLTDSDIYDTGNHMGFNNTSRNSESFTVNDHYSAFNRQSDNQQYDQGMQNNFLPSNVDQSHRSESHQSNMYANHANSHDYQSSEYYSNEQQGFDRGMDRGERLDRDFNMTKSDTMQKNGEGNFYQSKISYDQDNNENTHNEQSDSSGNERTSKTSHGKMYLPGFFFNNKKH